MKDEQFADGIYEIMSAAEYVLASRGEGGWSVSNGVAYENEVFRTIPFIWDEDDPQADEPNFEHFSSGLRVEWYKHVGRSTESNIELKALDWYRIVVECLESLKADFEKGAGA